MTLGDPAPDGYYGYTAAWRDDIRLPHHAFRKEHQCSRAAVEFEFLLD